MEACDVELLIKNNLVDILKKVIAREQMDPKLTHALIAQLHDKDGRMIERIYERLLQERLTKEESIGNFMSPLQYNMMVQSAAVYKRHRLLAQLVLESTVLGVPIDTQSYIKTIIATHYDRSRSSGGVTARPWGQDNLAYLYTLFETDVPREDYALANVLLQEYVSTVSSENYDGKSTKHSSSSSKERRKSKRSSKDKSSRSKRNSSRNGEIDWKSIDAWTLTEGNIKGASSKNSSADDIQPPIDLQSHGQYQQQIVVTPDQFEYDELIYGKEIPNVDENGEFLDSSKKRHALYKSRMAELAQYRKLLRKERRKNEKGMAA